MLGSLLGRLYRSAIGRLLGFDALVEERIAPVVRREVDAALGAILGAQSGLYLRPDIDRMACLAAAASSADYMVRHMRSARNLVQREALLAFALEQCAVEGLVLEFGVFRGASLRFLADHSPGAVYGFDSFEGLPEDWTPLQKKGRFSLAGETPQLDRQNIVLVKGWFSDTLPAFLARNDGPARFIHVDCDLYSSTVTVLTHLRPRIVPGTIIVFDEYFNYPGWEHHEHKAFQEFIAASGLACEFIGLASAHCSVAVRMG